MTLGRVAYRSRQFHKAVTLQVDPSERLAAVSLLPSRLRPLFLGMSRPVQCHHLSVYRALTSEGWQDTDLLAAALLHDVGKGRVTALDRAAFVLLSRLHRGLPTRAATLLRWPALGRIAQHPEIGARVIAGLGGSERLVWLVRYHQHNASKDPELLALQRADDAN